MTINDAITKSFALYFGHTGHVMREGVKLLEPIDEVVDLVVKRLIDAGISEITIRNALAKPLAIRAMIYKNANETRWRTSFYDEKEDNWLGIRHMSFDTREEAESWLKTQYATLKGVDVNIDPE